MRTTPRKDREPREPRNPEMDMMGSSVGKRVTKFDVFSIRGLAEQIGEGAYRRKPISYDRNWSPDTGE